MGITLKENAVNQIPKGSIILKANEPIAYICMVLKGRINIFGKGIKCILGSGSFIGITDTYLNRYICTYEALDDASIYVFPAKGADTVKNIINMNKDYHGIMIASLCKQIVLFSEARNNLLQCAKELYNFLSDSYDTYIKAGNDMVPIPSMAGLQFFEQTNPADSKKISYYTECAKVPLDVQKSYFSPLIYVTMYHVNDISGLITQLILECMEISDYIEESAHHLMNNTESSLYKNVVMFLLEHKKKDMDHDELANMPDHILDQINQVEKTLEVYAGYSLNVNREKMEQLYMALLSGEEEHIKEETIEEKKEEEESAVKRDVKSLNNSLEQIISFAELNEEQAKKLTLAITYFKMSNDKLSTDDKMRHVKKEITSVYYIMYNRIFLKARETEKIPKAIRLFLDYGFIDETLLDESQLYELCSIKPETSMGPCKVYTMCEWLEKVYQGRKETSKNEFDEDYASVLRNERKRKAITEEQERALYQDDNKRLEFEINNMFAINNRLTNGQIYTFVPILYKEMFVTGIEKSKLTKKRINDVVSQLVKIDYTIFKREVLYVHPELKIAKEYIIKTVFPNIILTPTVGIQASMWQEVSNKRKDTPARFIFPTFTEGSIEDLMIKMFGRFRWEICRNIQGAAWNNIQEKSLTSEYCDYLQFYKKSHDLSEERKEKLKLQIQKARNNSREVFVMDYEVWIKGEAAGAVKLNKVVREIMATYCPFSLLIREKLSTQPIFEEAMARYKREKLKKIREVELRYHALQKDGAVLTKELTDTLEIYKNQ